MKLTPLFILLWVFVWVGNAVFAQAIVGREEIRLVATDDEDTSDDGTREGSSHHEAPANMSLLPSLSPYAYLYNNKVVVSFDGICQNVRISVVNNDTDEVVFEEVYAGSPEVSIRLAERGDYTLLVRADGTVWEGWFVY